MADYQELVNMPVGSMGDVGDGVRIIRVPGGWVYRFIEGISIAAVFVPEPKESNNGNE